jgi:hypothetical protein
MELTMNECLEPVISTTMGSTTMVSSPGAALSPPYAQAAWPAPAVEYHRRPRLLDLRQPAVDGAKVNLYLLLPYIHFRAYLQQRPHDIHVAPVCRN